LRQRRKRKRLAIPAVAGVEVRRPKVGHAEAVRKANPFPPAVVERHGLRTWLRTQGETPASVEVHPGSAGRDRHFGDGFSDGSCGCYDGRTDNSQPDQREHPEVPSSVCYHDGCPASAESVVTWFGRNTIAHRNAAAAGHSKCCLILFRPIVSFSKPKLCRGHYDLFTPNCTPSSRSSILGSKFSFHDKSTRSSKRK